LLLDLGERKQWDPADRREAIEAAAAWLARELALPSSVNMDTHRVHAEQNNEEHVRDLARNHPKSPFLLCVSFTGPHYPYRAPQAYWDLYSDADVDLPAVPENYLDLEHEHVKWLRKHGQFDRLVPEQIVLAARRAILGRISLIDDYVGRILACSRVPVLPTTLSCFTPATMGT